MSREIPPSGSVLVSGGQKITNFHYPNRRFEKTEFVEYPKWVNMTGYEAVLAYDAETEAELLARPERQSMPKTPRKIVSSTPIVMQNSVQVTPEKPITAPVIPKVWWKRVCLWLSITLEELSR